MSLGRFLISSAIFFGLGLAWGVSLPSARADDPQSPQNSQEPMIVVEALKTQVGGQMGWGACPCVRWTFQVEAGAGKIETKSFLVSTQALLKFRETTNPTFMRHAQRIFQVGAAEALLKGAHIGLGFRGVTVGHDYDKGYTDLVRTGVYAILNLILTDSVRLDLRTAYDWEKMRINLGEPYARGNLDESLALNWATGRWSGDIQAHIGLDASHGFDSQYLRAGAQTQLHLAMVRAGDFKIGTGLQVGWEHDAFQELFGLPANSFNGLLSLDVAYVVNGGQTERLGW